MIWILGSTPPPPPLDFGVDWDKYLKTTSIALKDAIALTLSINPEKIYKVQRPVAFTHRLGIALGKLNDLTIIEANKDSELTQVTLASVISLAKKNQWSIPAELEVQGANISAQKHTLGAKDVHPMHYPVVLAREKTSEPKSNVMVWATLREMAMKQTSVRPLLDFKDKTEDAKASILYQDLQGETQHYTYKNFTDKMARLRKNSG